MSLGCSRDGRRPQEGWEIQQAPREPGLRVLKTDEHVSYLTLLRNGDFLRFFLAQTVSSLGDWIGVIAIAVFARQLGGYAGVGTVMTARVLPGFIVGPVAGVIADRWDRKRTMVLADVARALLIFSLPFFPNLLYLLAASVLLESLTLIWGPAKDASLPHFIPPGHLHHANSLTLLAVYGPWPLASIVFVSLETLGGFFADSVPALGSLRGNEEALALWVDSLTFVFSAVMVWTVAIPATQRSVRALDFAGARSDLVEGLRFVRDHSQVRPWLIGIAFTFAAAGGVFSLGVIFVEQVLHAGDRGFGFLTGFLGTGMIVGLLGSTALTRWIEKDVLFSASIVLASLGLILLGGMGSLDQALPVAAALGFFGGVGYSTGYALMHEATDDELRGRTFSAVYTVIRIGILVGLGLFPLLAGAIGDHRIGLPTGTLDLPGSRTTLWLSGLVALAGGLASMRAIARRRPGGEPVLKPGYFIVFEGGEGAGKSTQMTAFVEWLEARGHDVVQSFEPGGTAIGKRIRALLLDPDVSGMDARAEALLYAADRAQHVTQVIKPALEAGKIVVSDRFVDSSLAYQGVARGLGLEEVYNINEWATGGVLPDLVIYLQLDSRAGLRRVS
ncbi:MAG: dTMP kinase, partial [Actinobacteria bacterium]|nr:dTMP kinase [Actinomycetota bacterium]